MTADSHIGARLFRARDAFERRLAAALQEDSPALAIWDGALGAKLSHAAMPSLRTDMPAVLGGDGAAPLPGWYFRAGVASCMVTSIAMHAAMCGVKLKRVEVQANSESHARGMLGSAPDAPPCPPSLLVDRHARCSAGRVTRAGGLGTRARVDVGALMRPIDVVVDLRLAVADGA